MNPQANGGGTALASKAGSITIQVGQTTNLTIDMISTITTLKITPSAPSVAVKATTTLAVAGYDASGAMVLLTPSKLTWTSSATSVATVNSSGVVTGGKAGSATITVTDTESGKSTTAALAVATSINTVTVSATVDWQHTGVSVKAGDTVTIMSTGIWSSGYEGNLGYAPQFGPDGFNKLDPTAYLPNVHVGTLLVKINNNLFAVGASKQFLIADTGELQLGMNEIPGSAAHSNNTGSLTSTITIK